MATAATATAYCSHQGWTSASGIARLCKEEDVGKMRTQEAAVGVRPRGILSGFLVIVPGSKGLATFLPPSVEKAEPVLLRLRAHPDLFKYGCVLSAYRHKRTLVVEDALVWREEPVFYCMKFPERWALVHRFFRALKNDPVLQGVDLVAATYAVPSAVTVPEAHSVVEWVPFEANQRRLVVVPSTTPTACVALVSAPPVTLTKGRDEPPRPVAAAPSEVIARRDPVGPDVYQLWRGSTSLGQALVRTLTVSKALRLYEGESVPVSVTFHKGFSKWEVTGVC
jgi:hypothetical protein